MKAWLYRDFKWWFTGWLALLIGALFLYVYNKELGEVLLRFTGTILVALLTAMAAFDHMNTNERRKLERENYLNFFALLSSLDERYQNVMMIRDNYKNLFEVDAFYRGISSPYTIMRDVSEAPEMHKLNFLKKKLPSTLGKEAKELVAMRDSAFNITNIRRLFSEYDYLVKLVNERNKVHKNRIRDLLDKHYSGGGQSTLSPQVLKNAGISYAELTNFLTLTEQIMQMTDDLYHDLRGTIDELCEGRKEVIDSEIASEHFGYPTIKYGFENDDLHYRELSVYQQFVMCKRDYYSDRDFRQRFF